MWAGAQGGFCAGRGAQQAFRASTASLSPSLLAFLKWAPELILGSTAFPSLQVRRAVSLPCDPGTHACQTHMHFQMRGCRIHRCPLCFHPDEPLAQAVQVLMLAGWVP
jgi:hypothetical protein